MDVGLPKRACANQLFYVLQPTFQVTLWCHKEACRMHHSKETRRQRA